MKLSFSLFNKLQISKPCNSENLYLFQVPLSIIEADFKNYILHITG